MTVVHTSSNTRPTRATLTTLFYSSQGEYSLYYTNCVPNTAVSFKLEVELFNPKKGGGKDYLSAGEKPLPTLYLLAFFVYAGAGAVWALTLFNSTQHQPGSVHQIHLLMGVLVFFKCLTVRHEEVVEVSRIYGRSRPFCLSFTSSTPSEVCCFSPWWC